MYKPQFTCTIYKWGVMGSTSHAHVIMMDVMQLVSCSVQLSMKSILLIIDKMPAIINEQDK